MEMRQLESFVDPRDSKTYEVIEVGNQVWMAENLDYDVGEGSWFCDDDPENAEKYGRLYAWEAAKRATPAGWRLPARGEWEILLGNFGGKDLGRVGELSFDNIETNLSGLNVSFGGFRRDSADYLGKDKLAYFWLSTLNRAAMDMDLPTEAHSFSISLEEGKAFRYGSRKITCGLSVRLIKD